MEGSFQEQGPEAEAMVHPEGVPRRPGPVKGDHPRGGRVAVGMAAAFVAALVGCGETTTTVPAPLFGQAGELEVDVRTPILDDTGSLHETLVWRSEGPWVLAERVSYRGILGDETLRRSRLNPGDLAPEYASLMRQLNETRGLTLFIPDLPQGLEPLCPPPGSRVTLVIRDRFRNETARWVRCAAGPLFGLEAGTAGPDGEAARVVTAAQLAGSFTLGGQARSTYLGTIPFATLDRGESSPARPTEPRVFSSDDGAPPGAFLEFWESHAGSGTPLPQVDWEEETVLLAALGRREEAGDSVKVLRVLPLGETTRVELVDRVPGDFCSPAARTVHPFHLVVVPRVPLPVEFTEPRVERVPCGL